MSYGKQRHIKPGLGGSWAALQVHSGETISRDRSLVKDTVIPPQRCKYAVLSRAHFDTAQYIQLPVTGEPLYVTRPFYGKPLRRYNNT